MLKDVQIGNMLSNEGRCGLGLHDVFERWLDDQNARVNAGLKKVASLRTDLNGLRHVMGFLKDEDITKIDTSKIETYQLYRLAEGLKAVTINTECRKLKAILNWCHKNRLLQDVPAVPMLPEPPTNTEVPLEHELLSILAELPFQPALLTRLMAETGLRPSEAKRLRWEDVDLDRNLLRVRKVGKQTPKTHYSYREVVFGNGLAEDLLQQRRSTNMAWVFPNRDGADKPMDNYRKSLLSAISRSGVTRYGEPIRFTPKYCRKAFTSYQYLRGTPLSTIKQLVGHSPNSRVTEAHYLHIPESSLRNTVFELGEGLKAE